jgi:hypothetical protein
MRKLCRLTIKLVLSVHRGKADLAVSRMRFGFDPQRTLLTLARVLSVFKLRCPKLILGVSYSPVLHVLHRPELETLKAPTALRGTCSD